MKLYAIFIDANVDEGEDRLVALATSEGERDRMVAMLKDLAELNIKLGEKYHQVSDLRRNAHFDSMTKFPYPLPTPPHEQEPKIATVNLIEARKVLMQKGDVENANIVLGEIKEAECLNSQINERNAGKDETWKQACAEIEARRNEYFDSIMNPYKELMYFANNMPYDAYGVRWEEVETDTFLRIEGTPLTHGLINMLRKAVES